MSVTDINVNRRRRLAPGESRLVALRAARQLLMEAGPQAVTLKAVAARIGRTHANLLHHFGSAAGLQKELAAFHAREVCAGIAAAVQRMHAGVGTVREIVDLTFNAFDRDGAGALAAWMLASGNEDALDPVLDAIRALMEELSATLPVEDLHRNTFGLVLMALGDSLIGEGLSASLGIDRAAARAIAEEQLTRALQS